MPLRKPVSFTEAESYLKARQDRPTALNSTQYLTLWDKEARRKAFFSARVASADILAEFHRLTQAVVEGRGSQTQAVELMREFLMTDGRSALERGGWMMPREAEGKLTELASTRRLNLIVYQNVKIAQETGSYQQWAQVREDVPYGQWQLGYSEEHRAEHVARDGRIYPFDHPIWTVSPPGSEFNCHCYRREMTAAEARASGATIEPVDADVQPGLVDFDPSGGLDLPPVVKEDLPPDLRAELRKALGMENEEEALARRYRREVRTAIAAPVGSDPTEIARAALDMATVDAMPFEQAKRFASAVRQWKGSLRLYDVGTEVVGHHLATLKRVPPAMRRAAIEGSGTIHIGARPVTGFHGMAHLKGVTPRGWEGTGYTWDDVGGAGPDRKGAGTFIGADRFYGGSRDTTALHELGHAADVVTKSVENATVEHQRRLYDKLDGYFQQGGPGGQVGAQELAAQGMAQYLKWGHDYVKVNYDRPFATLMARAVRGALWK